MPQDEQAVVVAESTVPGQETTVPGSDGSAAASAAAGEGEKPQSEKSAEGDEAGKPKGNLQRRMNELVRTAAIAEARAEQAERLLLAKGEPAKPAQTTEALKEPQAEDFETTEAWTRAWAVWSKDEAKRELRAEMEKARSEEVDKERLEREGKEWQEKKQAVAKEHEDYTEVTQFALDRLKELDVELANEISDAIIDSDIGPHVLYHLGQHPEEIEQFEGVSLLRAVKLIGQIEARVAKEEPGEAGEKPAPPQTRAPRPPTPIKKVSAGKLLDPDDPADAEKMTTEEWAKARAAKLRAR